MNTLLSDLYASLYSGIGGLAAPGPTQVPAPVPTLSPMWIAVRQRFQEFNRELGLTTLQQSDGRRKASGVVSCLNRRYYGSSSETNNSFMIGSWGKDTASRPPRDLDLYFALPAAVYQRFENYVWNKQSALLAEVKGILEETYPNTEMRGDGQVVIVGFESFNVEVVPAFLLTNGRYWICRTENGGSYTETNPQAELDYIDTLDRTCNNNLRPLIRMLKAWQAYCSVPIKSFQLELVSADFLGQSAWRERDFFYFDWICRDFFEYLGRRANTFVTVPGTAKNVSLGDEWQSRAVTAHLRAQKACDYEQRNIVEAAGDEWQKILGRQIPRTA